MTSVSKTIKLEIKMVCILKATINLLSTYCVPVRNNIYIVKFWGQNTWMMLEATF